MSQHQQGTHTWTIKNVGEGTLDLWMEGKPTCSCTIAKLENGQKAVIPPGESTTIDLEWNTKDFHEKYSQGATFGTNDPSHPTFQLTVAGDVYPPVSVYPPQLMQFPSISNEEPHDQSIAVYSQDRPKLKLTKLTTSKPNLIVAEATPLTEEDGKQLKIEAGYRVKVTVKPGMPVGQFHEELVIQTDHPNLPEVKVSVTGTVTGPIGAIPPRLRMANVPSRLGGTAEIILLVRGGRPTQFEVMYKPEQMEIAIVQDDTPTLKGRYRMTVTLPPGVPAGRVESQIILKTDHPQAGEVKIPVSLLVTKSAPG
jgi:hypothetical protein